MHLCQTDRGLYTDHSPKSGSSKLTEQSQNKGGPNATLAIQTMHRTYGVISGETSCSQLCTLEMQKKKPRQQTVGVLSEEKLLRCFDAREVNRV